MSEAAIQKLKRKFIRAAMLALVLTMLLVAGLLYLGSIILNRQTIRSTLEYIADNNGYLISWEEEEDESLENSGSGNSSVSASADSTEAEEDSSGQSQYERLLEALFSTSSTYKSPEFRFSTRYFVVTFDENEELVRVQTSHITAVSDEEAETYGRAALEQWGSFGRIDSYYYLVRTQEDGSKLVVYMDSSDTLSSNERLLYLALILIGFGMVVAFFIVRVVAGKAIQTEVRNAELQKQFMTNASHELKTPLAVIRANTEMIEMLDGESEWTQSNMRQIERMNGLIKNLVMITRADENNMHEEAEDVDISAAIHDTAQTFRSMAVQNGKQLTEEVPENIRMRAEEAQIRQLCSLLIDNAIKYCDENGEIKVVLAQKSRGRGIVLTVSNSYEEGKNVDYSRFFERFYREDQSHNTDRGGYGIGLSIAESLVKQYSGTIHAEWKNGVISFICQLRPAKI